MQYLATKKSMAIVKAPFAITGTIDDLNFYLDQDKINRVRKKVDSTKTTKKNRNAINHHLIKMQGQEMSHCSKTSKIFRLLTQAFNNNAKDGSYAGRANALFLNIVKEDHKNVRGSRLVTEGIKSKYGQELLLGFESNKLRSLLKVIAPHKWELKDHSFHLPKCKLATDIDWPEDATHITFNLAIANWNLETNHFTTIYGEPQFFPKTSTPQDITITVKPPTDQDLHLTFVFIGFSKQIGSKHNTATLIAYHYFPQHLNDNTPAQTEASAENLKPPFIFS